MEESAVRGLLIATIYKLYIGRSGATVNPRTGSSVQYLTWGKDEVAKFDDHLRDLEKKLGDVTFVGGKPSRPPASPKSRPGLSPRTACC